LFNGAASGACIMDVLAKDYYSRSTMMAAIAVYCKV